jgi:hypothetical protein
VSGESAYSPKVPNFFLVGAPKAGTTALYRYLDQHPGIYMSPIKEPNFLANEIRLENFTDRFRQMGELRLAAQAEYLRGAVSEKFSGGPISDWSDYLKLFQCARDESAIGEASACYLWSETAPGNIASRFPDARILMILRNPIERALSQYAHMLSFTERRISFREYMDTALRSNSTRIGELYPFLRFGLYYEQVKRYQSAFAADRIQIHFYEDFTRDPRSVLRAIFRFLSVDTDFAPDLSNRHMEASVPRFFFVKNALNRLGVWHAVRGRLPAGLRSRLRGVAFQPRNDITLESADRTSLAKYYRDDIDNLARLLNRDLSAWFDAGAVGSDTSRNKREAFRMR